jgi:hypothetical protein
MLIGYAQSTDLQRDALLTEGIKEKSIYQDYDSGRGRVEDNGIRLSICDFNSAATFPFINWLSRLSR